MDFTFCFHRRCYRTHGGLEDINNNNRPFRSSALSFPGAKSPQRELLLQWNFRFVGHLLLGTFAPVELSFLGSERSKNFRSYIHLYSPYMVAQQKKSIIKKLNNLTKLIIDNNSNQPMKLSFHENYSKKFCSKWGFGNQRNAIWRSGNMRINSAKYEREPRVQCKPESANFLCN